MSIAIAIHGGAGTLARQKMTKARERVLRSGLETALDAGLAVLRDGGAALDAVVAAVMRLEDDPLFNAGCGAVFNELGEVELEAAVMDGLTRAAGSVIGVTRTRNPVRLARAVMDDTPHVTLGFGAADAFAQRIGLPQAPPGYFHTETRWKELQDELERRRRDAPVLTDYVVPAGRGTVGAVARDAGGRLAAATSTGGRNGKMAGRVGDSGVIGAGTWADDTVAVSCTGNGEWFVRGGVAHEISARMRLAGQSLEDACDSVVLGLLPRIGGEDAAGGVIAVDARGNISMPFNCEGMYRAAVDAEGARVVAIYRPA